MTDRRPDRVYALLVRDGKVFLRAVEGTTERYGLPGGVFRPLAEDRKVELRAHLQDQLGIEATKIWAQGGFEYRDAAETEDAFSGFYTVWEWHGDVPRDAGIWIDARTIERVVGLPESLRVLIFSVLDTVAMRTGS